MARFPFALLRTTFTSIAGILAAQPVVAQHHDVHSVRARFAYDDAIVVVAHRGCHSPAPRFGFASAPENSLLALDRCVAMRVDVMETDVVQTADGNLVIMHDDTVNRTTDGSGRVAAMTLDQLRKLRLRDDLGGPEAALTSQRVVTLEEMLAYARGRILLNLDIKASIYPQVIEAVGRAGATDYVFVKAEVGIASPPLAGLAPFEGVAFMPILLNAEGDADLGAILDRQLTGQRPVGVELPRLVASQLPAVLAAAKRHKVRLMLNTLGDGFLAGAADRDALRSPDDVWGRYARAGITIFQTDEPAALVEYRDHRRPKPGN